MYHILRLNELGIGWTEKEKGRFRGSGRPLLAGQDTCHRGPIVRPRFMSLACVFNAMRGSFGGVAGDGLACQWGGRFIASGMASAGVISARLIFLGNNLTSTIAFTGDYRVL